jgi:hypothetical protein
MGFTEQNRKERLAFIDLWSAYVAGHNDRDWSRQQNIIINSCLESAHISVAEYLKMKSGRI